MNMTGKRIALPRPTYVDATDDMDLEEEFCLKEECESATRFINHLLEWAAIQNDNSGSTDESWHISLTSSWGASKAFLFAHHPALRRSWRQLNTLIALGQAVKEPGRRASAGVRARKPELQPSYNVAALRFEERLGSRDFHGTGNKERIIRQFKTNLMMRCCE
ncbi:hypothetical protein E4U21_005116 [Claviceps maximensis]|nr:hypothetical protein E4U21_005116 [Claviceps maximensis]